MYEKWEKYNESEIPALVEKLASWFFAYSVYLVTAYLQSEAVLYIQSDTILHASANKTEQCLVSANKNICALELELSVYN